MAFDQSKVDTLRSHISALEAAKARQEAMQVEFEKCLSTFGEGIAEGDVYSLTGPVSGITKINGVVKYVIIPGLAGAGNQ